MMTKAAFLTHDPVPVGEPTAKAALQALAQHLLERFSLARLEWRTHDGALIACEGVTVAEGKTRDLVKLNPEAPCVVIADLQADSQTFLNPIAYQSPAFRALAIVRFQEMTLCCFDQLPRPDFTAKSFVDLIALAPVLDFLQRSLSQEATDVSAPAALWLNPQTQSLSLNARACALLGTTDSGLRWAQFLALFRHDDQAALLTAVARACHQGVDFAVNLRTRAGTRLRLEGGRLSDADSLMGAIIRPTATTKPDLAATLKAPLKAILDFAETSERHGTDMKALHVLRQQLSNASKNILQREQALTHKAHNDYSPDIRRLRVLDWIKGAMAYFDPHGRVHIHTMLTADFAAWLDQKALKIVLRALVHTVAQSPSKGGVSVSLSRLIYQDQERLRLSWRGVAFSALPETLSPYLKALKAQYGFVKTPKDGQNLWIEIPTLKAPQTPKSEKIQGPNSRHYGLSKREKQFLAIQSDALRKKRQSV